jgi:hypothetical protein
MHLEGIIALDGLFVCNLPWIIHGSEAKSITHLINNYITILALGGSGKNFLDLPNPLLIQLTVKNKEFQNDSPKVQTTSPFLRL